MKLCSYRNEGVSSYGLIDPQRGVVNLKKLHKDEYPTLLSALRNEGWKRFAAANYDSEEAVPIESVEFLPIFEETVSIHCVGLNYAEHTKEAGMKQPSFPRTFMKIPAALVGHGQGLEKPTLSPQYDFEGELAVIIGKKARKVPAGKAHEYIAGYTCFMDGSVRDWQLERTLDQGKNFYRSSSMGPYIVTPEEVGLLGDLRLQTLLNGTVMQSTTFSKMIFPVPTLIEYISSFTELQPGDIIATGTPEGVGFKRTPPVYLQRGDRLEVRIENIGSLINNVGE